MTAVTSRDADKEKEEGTSTCDGEEALDFLFGRGSNQADKDRPMPYVVLLDLKLPKIDGLEVLREMKNDPKTRSIPVVVLTSSREQKDLVESYRLGVNSYIQKPVDFIQFQAAIEQIGLYWLLLNQHPDESDSAS